MTVLHNAAATASADRLGLALFLAAVLHALVILGVGFDAGRTPGQILPTLDITLVQTHSAKTPRDADYLAQANQDGAGNVSERVRAHSAEPQPQPVPPTPPALAPPQPAPRELQPLHAQGKDTLQPAPQPPLDAAQLIDRSMEIASLSAELSESVQAYAQRPREKHISARTREYKYASYMQDWIDKVERIGNLNYPDEARRERLSGNLLLDVALNPDGNINNIAVLRSSGHRVLDDAALRIVRLAAPYAPFPPGLRADTDVLHIIRTWEFLSSNQLSSK